MDDSRGAGKSGDRRIPSRERRICRSGVCEGISDKYDGNSFLSPVADMSKERERQVDKEIVKRFMQSRSDIRALVPDRKDYVQEKNLIQEGDRFRKNYKDKNFVEQVNLMPRRI